MNTSLQDIRILLGNTIQQGKTYSYPLYWRENNGMLLAGQSGTGKTATASFYLAQLALQGVQFIICDYDAPEENEETLSNRISFLNSSFYLPPVKTLSETMHYITLLEKEHAERIQDPTKRDPLLFVIDEASIFFAEEEVKNTLKIFAKNLLQMRKVNIRVMIIGQEWSSRFSSEMMRFIRTSFREKIFHKLDQNNAGLLLGNMATTEITSNIAALKTGQIWYNNYVFTVPYLTETQKKQIATTLQKRKKNQNKENVQFEQDKDTVSITPFLEEMFQKYGKAAGIGMTTKEDLICFLYLRGYSDSFITKMVSGSQTKIQEILDVLRLAKITA